MDPVRNYKFNGITNKYHNMLKREISNGVKKIKYLNLKPLIAFGIILLLLHSIVLFIISPYYKIWWADIALHISGGFLVGSFALWYIFNSNKSSILLAKSDLASKSSTKIFVLDKIVLIIVVISFAALIGVFWELFEFIIDKITGYKSYSLKVAMRNYEDTIGDLFFDLVGALISNIFLKFRKKS